MAYSQPIPKPTNQDHQQEGITRRTNAAATLSHPGVDTYINGETTAFEGTWPTSFTKGLPHDGFGIVDEAAFISYFNALNPQNSTPTLSTFDVPLGPKSGTFLTQPKPGEGVSPWKVRGWESPMAGHQHDLQGPEASAVAMAPAPRLGSDELVAEMAEVYAMALLRDTSFQEIEKGNGLAGQVAEALAELPWFNNGAVVDADGSDIQESSENRRKARGLNGSPLTADKLFRGSSFGCNDGPYISQFMLHGHSPRSNISSTYPMQSKCLVPESNRQAAHTDGYIIYGANRIDQRVLPQQEKRNYLVDWSEWLDVQNGADTKSAQHFGDRLKFIETPRDLATYVHFDALYQGYLNAALLMLGWQMPFSEGFPEPLDGEGVSTRDPFATFGGPHILTLVTETATRSLKAVRRQKYNFHNRARPEALGAIATLCANNAEGKLGHASTAALAHITKLRTAEVGDFNLMKELAEFNKGYEKAFDPSDHAVSPLFEIEGENLMLPMAFPEGSPMHPAYGAGHATVAGSCVTILKAFFQMYKKGTWEKLYLHDVAGLPPADTVLVPSSGGASLLPELNAPRLTVIGELNKLAANIAIGRNMAGVHYYSDYFDSLRMGERIAVGMLKEQLVTYREPVKMRFETFDGDQITLETSGDGTATLTGVDEDQWWLRHQGVGKAPEELIA